MRCFRHWKWNLDEIYVKINGEMHNLCRAVDPGNLTSIFLSGIFSLREDIPARYLIFG